MSNDNENTKKIQVQSRIKRIIAPCDKLSQIVFDLSSDDYRDLIDNDATFFVREGEKKGKLVKTPFWLKRVEGYESKLPPDPFTREVFFAASTAFEQGYRVITISMTLDALTGGEEKRNVAKEQYEAIKAAFEKLDGVRITVNMEPLLNAYPKYKKNYRYDKFTIKGSLLPCKFIEAEINGQKTLAIEILGESPLMTVAKAKQQLISYDNAPLAIAGQNNTPQLITIKGYLLRRIELMKSVKRKKGLNHSILFETLYRNCGLEDASDSTKRNARKEIDEILSSFKADGVIKDFEYKREGNAYRAIIITP